MKIQNFERQRDKLTDDYGLSFQAAINILECVEAFKKYDQLPQATIDGLQPICDMFGVSLIFNQKIRKSRLPAYIALTGIFTEFRATFLYYDDQKVSSWIKNTEEFHLHPNADNIFTKV